MSSSSDSSPRPITLDDLLSLFRVDSPRVSPDGRHVAYVCSLPDEKENRMTSNIWMVALEGGEPRRMTGGRARDHSPAWSPDGQQLAFVSDRAGDRDQLFVLPVDGGEATQVTDLPVAVMDPKWHPAGDRIYFVAVVPAGAEDMDEVRERLETRPRERAPAHVTEDRLYRFWDRWLPEDDFPHLFVCDVSSGQVTDLTPGSRRIFGLENTAGSYDVSPDGEELAFTALVSPPPFEHLAFGIFTVRADRPGELRRVSPEDAATHFRPRYSPLGQRLVWGRRAEPDFYADPVRLVLHDPASGEQRVHLEGWDRTPEGWEWSLNGRSVIVAAEERQRRSLFRVSMEDGDGEPERVLEGGWIHDLAPAPNEMAVITLSSARHPAVLAAIGSAGGDAVVLADPNDGLLSELDLGETLDITYAGADRDEVSMTVVLPPGHDGSRRAPLMQLVHGGPHGAYGQQWLWRWNPQIFAAQGWLVAMVNFHGSTGYGEAFMRSICGQQPYLPFSDVMKATDLLIERGLADPDRLVAAGPSYGGYLVSWIAGHTDRFRCIVDHAGVFDLAVQFGEDVPHAGRLYYGALPWESDAGMRAVLEQSPHMSVHRIVTPMLITHGEKDYRVPVANAYELFNMLRAKGVPARLAIYPESNHWITAPADSRHWYGEVISWINRWIGPGAS